jgi:hypothetical protein
MTRMLERRGLRPAARIVEDARRLGCLTTSQRRHETSASFLRFGRPGASLCGRGRPHAGRSRSKVEHDAAKTIHETARLLERRQP